MTSWGIAGIGKLGGALMLRCEVNGIPLKVYHPDTAKARSQLTEMTKMTAVDADQLAETDYVLLALPAGKTGEVVDALLTVTKRGKSLPVLINLSTNDKTADLREQFPDFRWMGIKLAGHAKALKEEGKGLFVAEEWEANPEAARLFREIGEIAEGTEEDVAHFNRQVTEAAIAAAVKLKEQLTKANYDRDWIRHALTCSFPQVVKAYEQDELGTFAKEVAKKISDESSSE